MSLIVYPQILGWSFVKRT